MRSIRVVAWAALAGLIAFVVIGVGFRPVGQSVVDFSGTSLLLGSFILFMGWLVAAYSARNLRGQRRLGRYAALLAVAILALWTLVVAESLLVVALAWTISGLAVAGLVSHSDDVRSRGAARQVAVRLLLGDVALWAAVTLLFTQGVTSRSELTAASWVVAALIVAAGVVRSAQVPAWRWLPMTAQAPSPVSALLHAGVVNGLGLLAIVFWPAIQGAQAVLLALVVIGLTTAVLATAAMRSRPDVKGKLASSTSAQMGYMAVQIGLGLPAFAMLHLIGHGFYKAWLFLRAGGTPRRVAAPSVSLPAWWSLLLAGMAAVAVALGAATWSTFSVVDAVPLVAAAAATVVGMAAMVKPDRRTRAVTSPRGRMGVAALLMAGLAAYVVLLGVWARVFEFPGVWAGWEAIALTVGVIGLGSTGLVLAGSGRFQQVILPSLIDPAARISGDVPPTRVDDVGTSANLVDVASKFVGTMWPLESVVAVNPLHDLQELDFADAAELAGETWNAQAFLSETEYLHALRAGRFTQADLVAAATGRPLPAEQVAEYLVRRAEWTSNAQAAFMAQNVLAQMDDERIARLLPAPSLRVQTLGEQAGLQVPVSGLANAWTALLVDQGRLWPAFQDRVRDLRMRGLRKTVRGLPADPARAIAALLDGVVEPQQQVGYLGRLLARDPGWAAHLKHRDESLVADLLAIRVCFDVLAAKTRGVETLRSPEALDVRARATEELAPLVDLLDIEDPVMGLELTSSLSQRARLAIWQRAWENRYRNRLVDRVTTRAAEPDSGSRVADAQIVMCIDVRSERFRRHAESVGNLSTYGYAGFFGLPVRHETASGSVTDQCPVLIKPSYLISEDDATTNAGVAQGIRQAMAAMAAAPGTALPMAEAIGMLAGLDSAVQTAAPGAWGRLRQRVQAPARGSMHIDRLAGHTDGVDLQWGISLSDRTQFAATMLRALGMTGSFSDLILIAGHSATVENNAFAAAYDCGACGGNGGFINARIMASILNDRSVRHQLRTQHGLDIPEGTAAVPAWHNTTTDDLVIDDQDVPPSHRSAVAHLRELLLRAQDAALVERLAELPDVRRASVSAARARAADWAQPQPEWGLAGNAAFVIGPRSLTRGLNLRGRVFLHTYEPGLDVDGSILETLLTAPMQVTQWINNQYYFATVDPQRFGAGDKTTHNAVGRIGVLTGASGDLRVGLPWQGVYTSQPGEPGRWNHEPLRLLVLVYAGKDDISAVLEAHPQVAHLVTNEWIALAAIDPHDGQAYSMGTDLTWKPWLLEEVLNDVEVSR